MDGEPLAGGRMTAGVVRRGAFVDAYGLTDRLAVLPALRHAVLRDAERVRHWGLDAAGSAGALEFLAGRLRWLGGVEEASARGLSPRSRVRP